MSAIKCPSPLRKISPAMSNTYIGEVIQSGNHKKYCIKHNVLYRTLMYKFREFKLSQHQENWSPNSKRRYNHPVFTTELFIQFY